MRKEGVGAGFWGGGRLKSFPVGYGSILNGLNGFGEGEMAVLPIASG